METVHFSRFQRFFALSVGVLCHCTFLFAVASMMIGIYTGFLSAFGQLSGWTAGAANFFLVIQFPLAHSWLLTKRGHAFLRRLSPPPIAGAMTTTWFAFIASLQILLTFTLWSPTREVLLEWQGSGRVASNLLYFASSVFLMTAMIDADLSLQSGSKGWYSVFRNRKPQYFDFPRKRTFQICRQPIYLAFALILWTAPVWTPDRLGLAFCWSAYCILGPRLKERRYLNIYGTRFREYQAAVSYFIPVRRSTRAKVPLES